MASNAPELRLSIEKALALTYAWVHKFTITQAVHETALDDESMSTENGDRLV